MERMYHEQQKPFLDGFVREIRSRVIRPNELPRPKYVFENTDYLTAQMHMESVVRYPMGQLAGYFAWLIVQQKYVNDEWARNGEFHGLMRVVSRHAMKNPIIIKVDSSCFDREGRSSYGAIYILPWDSRPHYLFGDLEYILPYNSPDRATLHRLGLHPLLGNSMLEYELSGLYKSLVQLKVKLLSDHWKVFQHVNPRDLLILVDSELVTHVLSGYYVIPPHLYDYCIAIFEIMGIFDNYHVEHEYREMNTVADDLAKAGAKLEEDGMLDYVREDLLSLEMMEKEFGSLVRLPRLSSHKVQNSFEEEGFFVIDNVSDPDATLVKISFGNNVSSFIAMIKACEACGFEIATANICFDSSARYSQFAIIECSTCQKLEDLTLLQKIVCAISKVGATQLDAQDIPTRDLAISQGGMEITTLVHLYDDSLNRSILFVETPVRPGIFKAIVEQIISVAGISIHSGVFYANGPFADSKLYVSYMGKAIVDPVRQTVVGGLQHCLGRA